MVILRLLLSVLVGYALVALAVCIFQEKMLFQPQVARTFEPRVFPNNIEKIYLDVAPDVTLQGVKSKNVPADAPVLLAFGGNAHNITEFTSYMANLLPNVNVVTFNYRTFGESTGKINADNILADAKTVYEWVKATYPNNAHYVLGVSLGTGPATMLAQDDDVKGLMLAMPYDEMEDLAAEKYPWLPVKWLFRNQIPSIEWAPHVHAPTQIIVAGNDKLIINARSKRLADAMPNVIGYHSLSGAGHVSLLTDPRLDRWIIDSFAELQKAARN